MTLQDIFLTVCSLGALYLPGHFVWWCIKNRKPRNRYKKGLLPPPDKLCERIPKFNGRIDG